MAAITFYNFTKRANSTAIPTGEGQAAEIYLKDGSSLLTPVFMLEWDTIPAFNMALFAGRYYKITDIVSIRNRLYEIHANVDVLATYKANILAASAFVAYDTAANAEIIDRRLSAKTTATVSVSTGSFTWLNTSSFTGTVVVAITGHYGVAYYLMTPAQADRLLSSIDNWMDTVDMEIPDPDTFADVLEAVGTMAKTVTAGFRQLIATGRASDNIRSATWFPFPMSVFPSSSASVWLGEYNTGQSAPVLSQISITDAANVAIPWQASDWRRNAPYHEIILEVPYIGTISINPSTVMDCSSIDILVGIDTRTGEGIARVQAMGTGRIVVIGSYSFNCGGSYAVGSSNVTPVQALTALGIGAAAAAATAGASTALAATAAGTGGIAGMIAHLGSQTTAISSGSGAAGSRIAAAARCVTIFHDTVVTPDNLSAVIGTPAGYVQPLAGKTGYVETRNFSVSGTMSERERAEINRLMDGGVYLE